jgi:hypothetical protein
MGSSWLFIVVLGCAPAGSAIQGRVTLDGAPLDEATISFVPLDPENSTPGWTKLALGHYTIAAAEGLKPGKYRVEIRALRATSKANANDPTLMEAKEAVPSRYNSQSQLIAELKAGKNSKDFDLKTK